MSMAASVVAAHEPPKTIESSSCTNHERRQSHDRHPLVRLRLHLQGAEAITDRELLVLAAKAAGVHEGFINEYGGGKTFCWNPLKDDGDALRLAVLLSLRVEPYTGVKMDEQRNLVANITDVYSLHSDAILLSEPHNLDPGAATRRAIVRAAAEIGTTLP